MKDIKQVIDIIESSRSRELLEDFLIGITTPKERTDLAQRLEIIKRLMSGQAHHEIARDLGVGVATVTRGSKELQNGRFKVLRND